MRRSLPLPIATALLATTGLAASAVSTSSTVSAASDPPRCVANVCVVLVDPTADRDGDGFADGDEEAAGTDPDDPESHPPTIDVILGILDRTSPSFWNDHHTELVVLPLTTPDGSAVTTGLGRFALDATLAPPETSSATRLGLTLHQQLGFSLPGITLDAGQSLVSKGSTSPGDSWSLVAGGSAPSLGTHTTQITYEPNRATATYVDLDAKGNGTRTEVESRRGSDGGSVTVATTRPVAAGKETGGFTASSHSTSVDGAGNRTTTVSTRTVDENGTTTHVADATTTSYADGSSSRTVYEQTTSADGFRTVKETTVHRNASGEVVRSSWSSTTYNSNGDVVNSTEGTACKDDECDYRDPELDMAMGWTTALSPEDFQRVAARITSTITTVEGWQPPPVDPDEPPVTTSPNGPLVALIDPDTAVTVLATGAPRFTSAQPDYDPRLSGLRDEIIGSGQLPPGTSPYHHDVP